jgi:hypothetical protein
MKKALRINYVLTNDDKMDFHLESPTGPGLMQSLITQGFSSAQTTPQEGLNVEIALYVGVRIKAEIPLCNIIDLNFTEIQF